MNKVAKWVKSFVNLLYPLHCASCGKHLEAVNESGVCAFCLTRIKPNPEPHCPRCGRAVENPVAPCPECLKMRPYFSHGYSACLYEGVLKELIHSFKYKNRRSLSGVFAGVLIDFIKDNPGVIDGIGIITFVPLHRKRAGERGFNQSEVLARSIGKTLSIPVMSCLEKTLSTKNQNELSREDRLVNIKGAFRINKKMKDVVKDAEILIIDDVMTTGTTLNESSRVLMNAGSREVRCLTLARGL